MDNNEFPGLDRLIEAESLLLKACSCADCAESEIKESEKRDTGILLAINECRNHVETALDIVRDIQNEIRFQ